MTQLRVGVDLGKTRCRAQVHDGQPLPPVHGDGFRGLAEPEGVDEAMGAVVSTVAEALRNTSRPDRPVEVLAVGAAGVSAAAGTTAHELLRRLAEHFAGAEVALATDALVAHAGALHGRPGVVLVAGTGSVALGVSPDGRTALADGWGPALGDEGSGAWVGREALRAVLRAAEQRGPGTAMAAAAQERFGDLARLPKVLAADGNVARTLAGFVPEVLRCAEQGDEQALAVLDGAAQALAELTTSAARRSGVDTVTAVGGLTGSTLLMDAWRKHLPASLDAVAPAGDALAGALLLTEHRDLPHESGVVRAGGPSDASRATSRREVPGDHPGGAPDGIDVDVLATEQARCDLLDLDLRGPAELVDLLLEAESRVPGVVAAARRELTAAVELAAEALAGGGRLLYVGAGTPGRLAAVDAAECPPTFGTDPDRVVAVLAGGEVAAAAAVEGAEDDAGAGARDLEAHQVTAADLVVGITASGRTPYVLAALDAARRHGARTVAVVNNPGSPARDHADVTVELLTGPEVLAGSTRLTAGSTQKVVLNTLSTSAMIRAGKTYGPWMVDMVASNEKLRRRARRILRQATGVPDEVALAALESSDWSTKVALVTLLTGLDPATARDRLSAVDGYVRQAVQG